MSKQPPKSETSTRVYKRKRRARKRYSEQKTNEQLMQMHDRKLYEQV